MSVNPADAASDVCLPMSPEAVIDLDRYPIDRANGERYDAAVENGRAGLARDGSAVLPGFLRAEGVAALQAEVARVRPLAYESVKRDNPYNAKVTPDLPARHPYRIMSPTHRFGVAAHDLGGSALECIYRWAPMRRLVADLLGFEQMYLHEDPSNSIVVQYYEPGGGLAWHFDRAVYSLVLNIQSPETAGQFEYAPGIRQPGDEKFDDVAAVLEGDHARVVQLEAEEGDLVLFLGRDSMHRVADVEGERARITAIFSYEREPGMKLDLATRRLFFGPRAPAD